MSLPIAATGPLNVEMKPILTVFCWLLRDAGPAISASAAARVQLFFRCRVMTSPRLVGAFCARYSIASYGCEGRFDRDRGVLIKPQIGYMAADKQ